MSLSPYLSPENLNGILTSTSKVGGIVYPDGLDKRHSDLFSDAKLSAQSVVRTATELVDTVADVADTVANAAGVRSPYYTIGYIPAEGEEPNSLYLNDSVKGLIRAVGSRAGIINKSDWRKSRFQNGVIIDGLGDIDATIAVDFSTNPMVFLSDSIVDNRVRVPTVVRMTVLVSNYLSDNLEESVYNALTNWDPTGAMNLVQMIKHNGNTRAQEKLYQLRGLMETGVPFTLYTPHGLYENMLIKSLSPRTDANKMDMLYCDIEFREVLMYTEYTTNPGKIPARRDVSYVGSGWTQKAAETIKDMKG